ncbi:MAG: VIT domain-containing protein, partial [Armatimonadota bacterium]
MIRIRVLMPALVVVVGISSGVLADGMLFPVERPRSVIVVPDQLFTVRYHHVDVTIEDQLCTTRVDQIFRNDSAVDREGIYIFPLPEGSAITRFSMYAGEEEIVGKILSKSEARSIYESIVRQRRDPALLEYIDRNTFRASVYPVPAHGEKRIRLNYAEVARKSGSTYSYTYPLSTERFSAKPLEDCRVRIKIKSRRPVTNIYSPTHTIRIDREDDHTAVVTWEARDIKPDTDLVLYYSMGSEDLGIDLFAHRTKGEKGFYALLASPRIEVDRSKILPKNVVFVLDRTGSMAGEKIEQAKQALRFCLNTLHDQDRFNLITFNESPDVLFAELEKPTPDRRKKALAAIDDLDATGGTNINEALTRALAQFQNYGESRNYIVFLTDG